MRNCSLRAISPFPTMFSKGLSKGVIVWEWVKQTKSLNVTQNIKMRFSYCREDCWKKIFPYGL